METGLKNNNNNKHNVHLPVKYNNNNIQKNTYVRMRAAAATAVIH